MSRFGVRRAAKKHPGHVYHWRHGWIPLNHAAALQKAHGNQAAADKLVPRKRRRKTPQHQIDYHTARQLQNDRYEHHTGLPVGETHRQEYRDYFGVGDHNTTPVEKRITYKTHLRDLAHNKAIEAEHAAAYDSGVRLALRHVRANLATDTENDEYDRAERESHHADSFGSGYADGMARAYEGII